MHEATTTNTSNKERMQELCDLVFTKETGSNHNYMCDMCNNSIEDEYYKRSAVLKVIQTAMPPTQPV
jgi:hypothetical protein